jgi:hypothetical protein
LFEDLSGKIVEHGLEPIGPRDVVHRTGLLEPFQHQDEPRRPAIGLLVQGLQELCIDRLSCRGDEAGLVQGQAQILPSNLRDQTISQVPGVLRRRLCTAQHDHACAWGKLRQGARDDLGKTDGSATSW